MCANHAVPPGQFAAHGGGAGGDGPVEELDHDPETEQIMAGQRTTRTKKPKMTRMSTLANGNSTRYAASTSDTAPLAPTIGMRGPGWRVSAHVDRAW
jgi:hypothetical protein